MQIKLLTNYNTILFHHVDHLSLWDEFVSPHHKDYFASTFDVTPEINKNLKSYSERRAKLGWENESKLLEWAYNGFPDHTQFQSLLDPIRKLEQAQSKSNISLKKILLPIATRLSNKQGELLKIKLPYDAKAKSILDAYAIFFPSPNVKEITCYLVHSPNEQLLQAGANGDDIYTELYPFSDYSLEETVSSIFHESFHKILRPRSIIKKHMEETNNKLLQISIPEMYTIDMPSFIDEIIVQTLCNVFLFGEDPAKHMEYLKAIDGKEGTHYLALWRGTQYMRNFLEEALVSNLSQDEFLKELIQLFSEFIKKKSYLEKSTTQT